MKISVYPEYTSVACNRIPAIADWNPEGIICYGASYAIVLFNTTIKGKDPLTTLSHHKARVNSVKWVKHKKGKFHEFLSCSNDKTAAIWSNLDGVWQVTHALTGHDNGVTSIDGLYTYDNNLTIYTTSIDSTVKIWDRINGEVTCKQTIHLGSGLCLTLKAHILPLVKKPILLCALDDHKIHIFTCRTNNDVEYHRMHTLSGHEDWVRGLDIMDVGSDAILVASGSQDTYIRLWRIQHYVPEDVASTEIKVEEKLFTAYDEDWSVKLDAVLTGHEGWVYGVQWHPPTVDPVTNQLEPVYRLLSSSLDKTLIIWAPETNLEAGDSAGVWVEKVRVGDVGGNSLGFYGSRFGPDGKSFMGHGYNGTFHIWTLNEARRWEPAAACGGHHAAAADVAWEPRGRFLLSAAADQTARLHARAAGAWRELARPQVHGYDMSCLAAVSATVYASAAEEKVIRVFEAPHNFITNFQTLTGEVLVEDHIASNGPEGASVPSLGLSNKAVFAGDDQSGNDDDGQFVPIKLTAPPTEARLARGALWAEARKLYAHGADASALAASADGALLASAARAAARAHAALALWETDGWRQIQRLEAHQLTVTQLAFSPDSRRLLSVSRDRTWTVFRREEGGNLFTLAASSDKSNGLHARIIWCCAWAHDGAVFATGSRDGKVCLWGETSTRSESSLREYAARARPLQLRAAVTALALAPAGALAALGLHDGRVLLYGVHVGDGAAWDLVHEMDNSAAHHLTVRRLSFKPTGDSKEMQLASCGNDNFVRIYNVIVH